MGILVAAFSTPAYASEQHLIAEGDSLWELAQRHGVTVEALAAQNDIADPDLILTGTTIALPGSGADPDIHVVAEGETLWDIAAQYGTAVGLLARQNGLEGTDPIIVPGQGLVITPGAHDDSGLTAVRVPETSRTHQVAPGESLWSIAGIHGTTTASLATANGIDEDAVLQVGQSLLLPGTGANLPEDLLASPDRLALVPLFDHWAAEYGIPADLLKSLAWFESGWNNSMHSSADAIGIGQILPVTADFVSDVLVGETLDPYVPEENIRLSARYLRYLLDETGDVRLAVASYYQGLTATRQHGIYRSSEFYVDGILAQRARFV